MKNLTSFNLKQIHEIKVRKEKSGDNPGLLVASVTGSQESMKEKGQGVTGVEGDRLILRQGVGKEFQVYPGESI